MATPWKVGQQAVIDRNRVVTIDHVTPSGRAMVAGRIYDVEGVHRIKGSRYNRSRLELLTPEIQAEMDLVERVREASRAADAAIWAAGRWMGKTFITLDLRALTAADVDKAEKLAAAIREVMEDKP